MRPAGSFRPCRRSGQHTAPAQRINAPGDARASISRRCPAAAHPAGEQHRDQPDQGQQQANGLARIESLARTKSRSGSSWPAPRQTAARRRYRWTTARKQRKTRQRKQTSAKADGQLPPRAVFGWRRLTRRQRCRAQITSKVSTRAPEIKRTAVNVAASMPVSRRARRHNTELPAKAQHGQQRQQAGHVVWKLWIATLRSR